MIPKVIHYCWFGQNPKPKLAEKCIRSWKKYLPDYEIKEWNESNYDIVSKPLYVRQAYEQKKWAFVSDYARFDILYQYGGLYFDTDVEVIRPVDDLVANGAFMACEENGGQTGMKIAVATGLGMAVESQNSLLKEILESYHSDEFFDDKQKINYKTVVERVTDILITHGLQNTDGIQTVAGFTIYPKEYFCPFDYMTRIMKKTNNTRTIHWYDNSWYSKERMKAQKKSIKRRKLQRFKDRIRSIIGSTFYEKMKRHLGK